MGIEEKIVMVTGASSGIGRELCLYLARAGFRIVAGARRIDRLISLCDEINDGIPDTRAVAVHLDIKGKEGEVEAAIKAAWEAFGKIDVLVNNAGIRGTICPPLELPMEEWNVTMATNLTGTWMVTKAVCKRMRDAKLRGSVINISSISGLPTTMLRGGAAYSASKAAIDTITRTMALELGEYGIRVNSIAPGLLESEITKGLMEKKWLKNVEKRIMPMKTFGTTNPAITSVVRYLLDDLSEYVTGNVFVPDAGLTLPGIPIFSSL